MLETADWIILDENELTWIIWNKTYIFLTFYVHLLDGIFSMFCFRDYLQYLKYAIIVLLENGRFYGFYSVEILEFYPFVFYADSDRNKNKPNAIEWIGIEFQTNYWERLPTPECKKIKKNSIALQDVTQSPFFRKNQSRLIGSYYTDRSDIRSRRNSIDRSSVNDKRIRPKMSSHTRVSITHTFSLGPPMIFAHVAAISVNCTRIVVVK